MQRKAICALRSRRFGKTDHDHPGKLITYGATLGANAVVWIAEEFTDERRKAIAWLNDHTEDVHAASQGADRPRAGTDLAVVRTRSSSAAIEVERIARRCPCLERADCG